MFPTTLKVIGGLVAALLLLGMYHLVVVRGMENSLLVETNNRKILEQTVVEQEATNKHLAETMQSVQLTQKQLSETMDRMAQNDRVTADAFGAIREAIAGNKNWTKLNEGLKDKPDETIQRVNDEIACMLLHLGTSTVCIPATVDAPVMPKENLP